MSTTPPMQPKYWPDTSKASPEVHYALTIAQNAIQQHEQAFSALKGQLDAAIIAKTTNNTTVVPSSGTNSSNLGRVNNQTGTTYTAQDSDYGGIITLDNAGAVAVTLNPAVRQFWFCAFENLGAGAVTITPAGGVVNNLGSIKLTSNMGATIFFDGTNWWATTVPIQPVTIAAVTTKFLESYDATTGLFVSGQPAFTDISGVATVAQIPTLPQTQTTGLVADLAAKAPIASPVFTGTVSQPSPSVLTSATTTTAATAGTGTALPALPEFYLVVNINGTGYKIPVFNL